MKSRRNPRLVPYALLDERTKKSNRDSLREAIRTLVGYGYEIDPPDQEGESIHLVFQALQSVYYNICQLLLICVVLLAVVHVSDDQSIETIRFFRVEQTYAVKSGKWYFEFEALTGGDMRVGWARPGCRPDVELGLDDQGFVFDGYRVEQFENN